MTGKHNSLHNPNNQLFFELWGRKTFARKSEHDKHEGAHVYVLDESIQLKGMGRYTRKVT